ncbi:MULTISPECIES: HU family DNA-binding protein [Imperialibacter]|uniref:HU family DNA-binding protein n=1 Tax=Imperialibacter roseus TaxID=1324217 RepID=A0ABZ0IX61_9BACT|nr:MULTISPECIES: HU family DNA-binding protein [Imperialibacter]WOK09618.1 HU family DNA-binding protein [Imperialibacter roseus]CAD5257253.1 putative DNA-binding protein, histone-like [Imperialibacter sp. 89]CAD5272256.1 putative DNA-binding protein, histone-like [Imperialibacter sp. 75]VVT32067.1 putative DNA-binding protein, histone-like [Imperialibacter sp. EC-SDR9]|tara:strand:- start:12188 stop:12616 length:429 start_codon:yes stop_codon:yes gene_type:complete
MSILYKAIGRTQPGVAGGGQIKYYAGIKREREVTLREMVREISSRSTVTTADAMAVIENFLELIPKFLRNGRTVNLSQLGSFRVNISSKGYDTPDEVGNYSIKRNKISFLPSAEMRENMGTVRYTKYTELSSTLLSNEPDEE